MIFGRDKKKETSNLNIPNNSLEESALNRWRNVSLTKENSNTEELTEDHGLKKRESYLTSLMRGNNHNDTQNRQEEISDSDEEYYEIDSYEEFKQEEFDATSLEMEDDQEFAYETKENNLQEFSKEDPQSIAIRLTQEFEEKDVFHPKKEEVQQIIKNETAPPAPPKPKVLAADFGLAVEDDLANRFGSNLKSALGEGTMIDGTFSFETPVKVEGTLSGEIKSQSALIVGKNARIQAKIKVGSLIVLGEVEGEIIVDDLIEIRSTGSILGNVTTKRLALEEGGMLQGLCTMIS